VRIARIILPAAVAAAAFAGCGSDAHNRGDQAASTGNGPRLTWSEPADAPATLLVVRRIRYEGATLRTLYVHTDGSVNVDVPNGGAGGAKLTGRITPRTLSALRRDIAAIPWRHLSHRKRQLDASGGYFMVRHAGEEHIAMSSGMSVDLIPLVKRVQGIFNGGIKDRRVQHRFGKA
jgi:hypothetical protein